MEGIRVAIVGGSIGGLSAAVALHRHGAVVKVFEKSLAGFADRGGSLGFCDVQMWEQLRGAQMLRRGEQAHRRQGGFFYGDLWRFWCEALPAGTIQFGVDIDTLGDDPWRPTVNGEEFDMAVVADGGWSTLRGQYFDTAMPEYAGYEIWRFRVEKKHVPNFQSEGSFDSCLGGPFFTILLNIAMDDGRDWVMGGVSIAKPEHEVVCLPQRGANRQMLDTSSSSALPPWFLPFYKRHFGTYRGGRVYEVMEIASRLGKISPNPLYEFAASKTVNGRLVLLGDAAHMASPRTASGAHTAVMDSLALFECFEYAKHSKSVVSGLNRQEDIIDKALAKYESEAIKRAYALYLRSKQVSEPVAIQGWNYKLE